MCSETSTPPHFHRNTGTFLNSDYIEIPLVDYIIKIKREKWRYCKRQGNARQRSSFVGLCVSLQCVCVLLSLSQVVVELSVWLVLNGAPRWHFEQPVQPRGTHCAHCPKRLPGLGAVWHMTCRGQAVRRCCSVSVLPLLLEFLPFILFIYFVSLFH